MPASDPVFDDILPEDEPGESAATSRITLVNLPADVTIRRLFMEKLQSELMGQFAQATLAPIPYYQAHAIGCASERFIRERRMLSGHDKDDAWRQQLKDWGADSVIVLPRDAFRAMLDLRTVSARAESVEKVFLPSDSAAPLATPLPTAAANGPTIGALASTGGVKIDWHLDSRGANVVTAWQKFHERDPNATKLPWQEILIGHLDTGYIPHEALAWDSTSTSSTTVLATKGYDYFEQPNDPDPRDLWVEQGNPGHGTRIDGAIAGYDPTDKTHPFYGAAPGVQVIPYRVTESVLIDHVPSNMANAIKRAVAEGCHVITICLGALRGDRQVARAVDQAYESGVIVVCAAGQVWPWVIFPGRFNRVMTVSGIGPGRVPWGSAACGKYVDWCGPADEIRMLKVKPNHNGYTTGIDPRIDGNGTSYATAITSGIAAMWLAWHGVEALHAKYTGQEWMIPAAFKRLVKSSCAVWPHGPTYLSGYGTGIIDAGALLEMSLPSASDMTKEAKSDAEFDATH